MNLHDQWGLILVAKPTHAGGGGDVDGLAYRLHHPTVSSCQSRGQGLPARRHLVLSLVLGGASCRETWSF
jgi:hypothetical protein